MERLHKDRQCSSGNPRIPPHDKQLWPAAVHSVGGCTASTTDAGVLLNREVKMEEDESMLMCTMHQLMNRWSGTSFSSTMISNKHVGLKTFYFKYNHSHYDDHKGNNARIVVFAQ